MSRQSTVAEHDDEAEPGLPAPLPPGEKLLWRGAPDWRVLLRHGFHFNKFALYFAVLIVWRAVVTLADGGTALQALATTLWTMPLAALALGIIAGLAWLVAHNAVYTITDRRVVMRVGIVLTVTFNLPLRRIETARLHALPGGSGDIALVLNPEDRIGYLHLWPHVRPWRFSRTEPTLRALPQAAQVAELLADALARTTVTALRSAAEARLPAQAGDAGGVDPRERPASAPNGPGRQPLANAA